METVPLPVTAMSGWKTVSISSPMDSSRAAAVLRGRGCVIWCSEILTRLPRSTSRGPQWADVQADRTDRTDWTARQLVLRMSLEGRREVPRPGRPLTLRSCARLDRDGSHGFASVTPRGRAKVGEARPNHNRDQCRLASATRPAQKSPTDLSAVALNAQQPRKVS